MKVDTKNNEIMYRYPDSDTLFTDGNPIGRVIKQAMENDFTITYDPNIILGYNFSVGYHENLNFYIVYDNIDRDHIKVKRSNTEFIDFLYLENDREMVEEIMHSIFGPSRRIVVDKEFLDSINSQNGEFNCIWESQIYVDQHLFSVHKQKIRFVPKNK